MPAHAQELEPRAYSAAPVGTNFLAATYTRLSGDVLTDPSLPITDVRSRVNIFGVGYVRVFELAGRTASLGLLAPFASGDVSGNVLDAPNAVHREGIGDARMRLAINLLGGPALKLAEFMKRAPDAMLGASLPVVAPGGQYDAARLVNVGTHRWAFKPKIGLSQPIGNWFAELSAGVWLFGDNNAFLGDKRRAQSPLGVLQWHVGYQFRGGRPTEAGHSRSAIGCLARDRDELHSGHCRIYAGPDHHRFTTAQVTTYKAADRPGKSDYAPTYCPAVFSLPTT